MLKLPNACSRYGAEMGRRNTLPDDPQAPIKLRMERLRWVDGDYDNGGAYWGNGNGSSIFCAYADGCQVFVRGRKRTDAKAEVRAMLPNARFYR